MAEKQENRIMGEYSIAKSYKGILRIAHILDLVKNEQDRLFNPTYYGTPRALVDLSKDVTKSSEKGHRNPKDGMDGSISRYSYINENGVISDELRHMRVPMTDSMGNYLNWNIGFNGITIGSNEEINGNAIDFELFLQQDGTYNVIWQQKYYPVLETKELVIGLQNKEYASDKYKINTDSGLIIENNKTLGKLIIENKYDKTNFFKSENKKVALTGGGETRPKTFIQYKQDNENIHRTVYTDNKNTVEEYDVFMYQQDDYDVHNYDYELPKYANANQKTNGRGNEKILSNYSFTNDSHKPDKKTIDANVGIVNLKDYVFKMIEKYTKSSLVEVPTGAIINQYCSLDKWYAYPDNGYGDDYGEGFPGHRPAMMSKRNTAIMQVNDKDSSYNSFVQSTIMGACRKINKLINPDYNATNKNNPSENEENDITITQSGFHKEIIPLYKRDYVLCDGSTYAIFLFPKNFDTEAYPNRRDSMDRFLDLFFSIGYQYTTDTDLLNNRFTYKWDDTEKVYYLVNEKDSYITEDNYDKLYDDNNMSGEGSPVFKTKVESFLNLSGDAKDSLYNKCDIHSLFVEDFLTILAFDEIYKKYSQAANVDFVWNYENICNWLKTLPIPEKYRLTSFIGDSNSSLLDHYGDLMNRTEFSDEKIQEMLSGGNFVMDIPYYNFNNDGSKIQDKTKPLPIINLGREISTFGSIIKFFDHTEGKWVMIPAYKLPQIQYFIRIFLRNPGVDLLAQIMDTYFRYNFQVPNLMQKVPTFIGSSGIDWADSQHRKIKKAQTWSSSYAQNNYMHRHLLFVESASSDKKDISAGEASQYNPGYNGGKGPERYKAKNGASSYSYVAPAAWWEGAIIGKSKTFNFGEGEHATYIFNEISNVNKQGTKQLNINLIKESINNNGMSFPIIQSTDTGKYNAIFPVTGNHRVKENMVDDSSNPKNDFYQRTYTNGDGFDTEYLMTDENDKLITDTSGKPLTLASKIWDIDDNIETGNREFFDAKVEYEKEHPYGFEHFEDPRFESAEPNRGRTSPPINVEEITNITTFKRQQNENNFTLSNGEWFCPENVKMLPLIKL